MEWLPWVHRNDTPAAQPAFDTGDDVRVWYRILEQGKERLGQFEGTVIRYRGAGAAKTFTVRRVTHGEGVERVFPLDAKIISRIEVLKQGHVNRSRLYYLRTLVGKSRIATSDTMAKRPSETGSAANPSSEAKPEAVVAGADAPAGDKPTST